MEEQQGTEENEVLGQEGEQRVRSEAGGSGLRSRGSGLRLRLTHQRCWGADAPSSPPKDVEENVTEAAGERGAGNWDVSGSLVKRAEERLRGSVEGRRVRSPRKGSVRRDQCKREGMGGGW